MDEISQSEKDHIIELVSSQKKAKLEWVSTVTKIPKETIIAYKEELGLVFQENFISIPVQAELLVESQDSEYAPLKPISDFKTRRSGMTTFAIICMIITAIVSLFFGVVMLALNTCATFIGVGTVLVILSIGLGFFVIRIFRRRK